MIQDTSSFAENRRFHPMRTRFIWIARAHNLPLAVAVLTGPSQYRPLRPNGSPCQVMIDKGGVRLAARRRRGLANFNH